MLQRRHVFWDAPASPASDAERPVFRRDAEGPKVMPVVHRDEGKLCFLITHQERAIFARSAAVTTPSGLGMKRGSVVDGGSKTPTKPISVSRK